MASVLKSVRTSVTKNTFYSAKNKAYENVTLAWWVFKVSSWLVDPLGRLHMASSDHYIHTCCPSVRLHFHKIKRNNAGLHYRRWPGGSLTTACLVDPPGHDRFGGQYFLTWCPSVRHKNKIKRYNANVKTKYSLQRAPCVKIMNPVGCGLVGHLKFAILV